MEVILSKAREILFGGASEGGKSHVLRVVLCVLCIACPGLQCVLIRKKYADIAKNHVDSPRGFKYLLKPMIDAGKVVITKDGIKFDNGAVISFQHCQDERQFDSAQGVEKHVLAIDEATQISERLIKFFRLWVRMTPEFKETLPEQWRDKLPLIIYTANPIGASVGFFRRHFVKARDAFEIEEVHGFLRQYIPSKAEDNGSIDLQAHKGRMEGMDDRAVARALDEGDWDAPTGDFFPEWDEDRHVVSDFYPPHWWTRFRSYDWGTRDPSVCYWIAISDGEPFKDHNGVERWFPRGALIFYQEWYIADPDDGSKGLRLSNEEMARGIVERSEGHAKKVPTITDSKPFQFMGGYGIEDAFRDNGCPLIQGDTSRVTGWAQMRARLRGVQIDSNDPRRIPMVYFCECCKKARDYIPALPRHPSEAKSEDAAEHGEATHACDAIRYACMVHSVIKDSVQPLEAMLARETGKAKTTIGKVLKRAGHSYF
jgi:hypothetical protein